MVSLGLRFALLKSRIKNGKQPEQMALAEEAITRGMELAKKALDLELGGVMAAAFENPSAFADEEGLEQGLLYVERQFLWGLFHEFVHEYPTPVNSYDRIKVLLINWLMKTRERSLEQARDEANAVEDLFNRDDTLFGIVSQFGKDAYYGKHSNGIAKVLKALLQARSERLAKESSA
ncbi:hypothetical protein [Methyloceanibacter sp.]|uniref:hypothetical protein n=1 Tax=Methyloceanibacter sp. TaxID=1965321 RepID=UPI002D6224A4|nr:hypothetical protein [Methyloceanibacter sp.]HZP09749.1 hypothetical protein [Methyloceanibacter sp.]